MNLRQTVIETSRRAPRRLGPALDRVIAFVRSRRNDDGAFRGRSADSDLYYTMFGLQALIALGEDYDEGPLAEEIAAVEPDRLDLPHLACWARCDVLLGRPASDRQRSAAGERIDQHREGGGFVETPGRGQVSPYACFLAVHALQDLDASAPPGGPLAEELLAFRADDGGFSAVRNAPAGATPTTAAAVCAMQQTGTPAAADSLAFLADRYCKGGGFAASPAIPLPDLLSTATALTTLHLARQDLWPYREGTLALIGQLLTDEGGFRSCWAEQTADIEYTFYGLLTLGLLAG
jgi:geranylgeranyl transferase type-2 subunit beta